MKKTLLILFLIGCKTETKKINYAASLKKKQYEDSFVSAKMDESFAKLMWDAVGLATAPLIVKSAKTVSEEYLTRPEKEIECCIKNKN